MRNRTTAGLAILAGGLAFVGSANALDLIVNGSFENPTNGWAGYWRTYNYSATYYAGPPVPASEGPSNLYGWRHASANNAWGSFTTPAADPSQALAFANTQTVELTNALTGAAIDAGLGRYTFSAWLASWTANPEQPYINLRFLDASGVNQMGTDVAFDRATANLWVGNADSNDPTPPDASNHMWSKYLTTAPVPLGARKAKVYVTRSFNSGLSGSPDTYVDLIKLNVININDTTLLDSATPGDGSINNTPAPLIVINLKDIATQVNTNTVQLRFDGVTVIPASITQSAGTTTVQYSPGVLGPLSTHTYRIVWSDNGSPVTTKTNQFQFSVAPYVNVQLGAPIYLEDFDSLAEGALPTGWAATNLTDLMNAGLDYNDPTSDAFTNWVVINRSTITNITVNHPGFSALLNVAPNQVVNGALVTNLASGNVILAVSDARSVGQQVQWLFTRDYDLTGRTNILLSFHSLYTQNQDSMGAVEYSINGGATWLPALYLLDGPDILRDSSLAIDGSNTMAVLHDDVPDLTAVTLANGNYGQFIGVPQNQWASLAPYLSARVNDGQVESKRVEVVRLAQADNQATVRLRFAQVGTFSWYFGMDDVGLYSPSTIAPPFITAGPVSGTVAVGNSTSLAVGTPLGVGPFTYQWRLNGVDLVGKTNDILRLVNAQLTDAGDYVVVVSNAGGSMTSFPALLTVINPIAAITGQWDFNQGDLRGTCGSDLQYYDLSVQTNTAFGTTTSFGIADVAGQPANVMKFTPTSGNSGGSGVNPTTNAWGGYKMFHGAAANGGGTNVNQYTLIFDVLYPSSSDRAWRAVIQASPTVATGGDDSEFYINQANGIGISGIYDGVITADAWHRIALAVDMGSQGLHPLVEKFIDGVKVGEQTAGLDGRDGRFSLLSSLALLFAEDNGYNNDTYVSSVQFRNERLSDVAIAAMGGPSANKIPGAICVSISGPNLMVQWSGSVLQSAEDLTGPWTTIAGASKPYTVPAPLGAKKFYRSL
jgi:hypothetical protein